MNSLSRRRATWRDVNKDLMFRADKTNLKFISFYYFRQHFTVFSEKRTLGILMFILQRKILNLKLIDIQEVIQLYMKNFILSIERDTII